jgi:hypothetical protein
MVGHLTSHSNCIWKQKIKCVVVGFLFLSCLFMASHVQAQSFHFFQYKIPVTGKDSLNTIALLTVFPDGSATCRLQYKDPVTQENQKIEACYTDSIFSGATAVNAGRKVLIPGEACIISGNSKGTMLVPSFVFTKITDSTNRYFEPTAVYYPTSNGWGHAVILQNKTYAMDGLSQNLVKYFYNENEPYYKNLFSIDTRSITQTDLTSVIHLIMVANTLDSAIGKTCKIDMYNVSGLFTDLSEQMGISVKPLYIFGKDFSIKSVNDALNKLKPKPNDIVVFYYSGHGFRTPQTKSKYPNIDLTTSLKQPLKGNFLNMEDIYNRIVAKGARLNLVLSDCCNEKIGALKPSGPELIATKSPGRRLSIDNCKALFFAPNKVSLLATSADVNQYASGNPSVGGFFSWHFKSALEIYTSKLKTNVSWLQVLNEARINTAQQAVTAICDFRRCTQYPWFSIKK